MNDYLLYICINFRMSNNLFTILKYFFFRDKVERAYRDLKRDLFQPHLSMEEQYGLIDKLYQATKCNSTLKKLFWRVSESRHFYLAMFGQKGHFCHSFGPPAGQRLEYRQ